MIPRSLLGPSPRTLRPPSCRLPLGPLFSGCLKPCMMDSYLTDLSRVGGAGWRVGYGFHFFPFVHVRPKDSIPAPCASHSRFMGASVGRPRACKARLLLFFFLSVFPFMQRVIDLHSNAFLRHLLLHYIPALGRPLRHSLFRSSTECLNVGQNG
jgi:hypothetical protein